LVNINLYTEEYLSLSVEKYAKKHKGER